MRKGPAHDIRKLAYWLPHHRDGLVLLMAKAIGSAMSGNFTPEFKPDPADEVVPRDPQTVKAAANRELDKFSRKADRAMSAYQQKKRAGRV